MTETTHSVRFYCESIGWFSTAYISAVWGTPFQRIAYEIKMNKEYFVAPITYRVFNYTTDITDSYEKWVSENS